VPIFGQRGLGEEKEKDKVYLEPAKVKSKSVDFGFR
jgi:hypothetical protein